MVGPAGFHFESPTGERWVHALELLAQGKTLIYRRVQLRLDRDEVLHASAELTWGSQVTEAHVHDDFARAEAVVEELRQDDAISSLVQDRAVKFAVVDASGMGGVLIATRRNGEIAWSPGFPRATR